MINNYIMILKNIDKTENIINEIITKVTSRVEAKADKVVWPLNAEYVAPTQSVAVSKVGVAVDALVKYLNNGGIPADAIEYGSVSAYPQEEWVNGSSTGRITSYRASRAVTVRTDDVNLVLKLSTNLGSLLETGINVSNYGPQYYLSTLNKIRPQLLSEATKDAKSRAEAMTKAVGGKVGSITSVKAGPIQVTTPDSTATADYGMYDTSSIKKTVTATVTVSFKTN